MHKGQLSEQEHNAKRDNGDTTVEGRAHHCRTSDVGQMEEREGGRGGGGRGRWSGKRKEREQVSLDTRATFKLQSVTPSLAPPDSPIQCRRQPNSCLFGLISQTISKNVAQAL